MGGEDGSGFDIVIEPPIALKAVLHPGMERAYSQSLGEKTFFFDSSSREVSSCVELTVL